MSGYVPLFDTVLDGTLFGKWPHTGIWTCLLSQIDKHGLIDKHPNLLAAKIGVPVELLRSCIDDFMKPDVGSRTADHDGRRLELIEPGKRDWGWRVLNHAKYREKARKQFHQHTSTESGKDAERKRESRRVQSRPDASGDVRLSDTNTNTDSNKERDVEHECSTPVDDKPADFHLDRPRQPTSGKQEARQAQYDAAGRVFDHWRTIHRHERAKLDNKRRKVIVRALGSGYREADLCRSISGYRNSPHHMGRNAQRTVYDDIELFLRDSAHIDRGLKFYEEPPLTGLSVQTQRIVDQTEGWEPPEVRARREAGEADA